jgi:hypothetical protein
MTTVATDRFHRQDLHLLETQLASLHAILALSMSTPSRIQQIIDHERSIQRSLTPFGLALALTTVMLVVFVVSG